MLRKKIAPGSDAGARRTLRSWPDLLEWIGGIVAAIILGAALFALVWFWWASGGLLGPETKLEDWSYSATFLGFVAQTFLGSATLLAVILISGKLTRDLAEQKRRAERSQELIRLSEKMVDTEFYVKVMYPAWEVALKWMSDDRAETAKFRGQVVGAEFRLPANYRSRRSNTDLAENNPRRHPHFQPYDQPTRRGGTPVIGELSESLAFATWVRFWRNVKFLIDQGVIDRTAARHLFREWYMWWAPFMTEFAWVCIVIDCKLRNEYGYRRHEESWRQSSIRKILGLQRDLDIPLYCGHQSWPALKARILKIADPIWKEVVEKVRDDPNPDIDGKMDEELKAVQDLRRRMEELQEAAVK